MSFLDVLFGRKKRKPTHFTKPDPQIVAEFAELEPTPAEDAAVDALVQEMKDTHGDNGPRDWMQEEIDRAKMTPEQLQVWRRAKCTALVAQNATVADVMEELGINSGTAIVMMRAVKRRQENPQHHDKQVAKSSNTAMMKCTPPKTENLGTLTPYAASAFTFIPSQFSSQLFGGEPSDWTTYSTERVDGEANFSNRKLKTLVIMPDAHACPKHNNSRFTIAGKFINDLRPDGVVCLGDFADMESLSYYDKGKKSFEGRRYQKDLKCAIDAQEKLFKEVTSRSEIQFDILYGNHEERINTTINDNPAQEGNMCLEDLKYAKYWDGVHPFKEVTYLYDIAFSHFFPNGLMDRPMSGANVAKAMVAKVHCSAIAGHRHDYVYHTEPGVNGKKIFGLVAGCFLDTDQYEHYVSKTIQKTWWKGLIVLRETPTGEWDLEQLSLDRLKAKYAS